MILQPNYYDMFKCIADKCKDNCCIGWEIDIDEFTFNKYMNTGGDLGNRLKNEIATENGVHYFKLKENERCPFLNSNNLCDIICGLGENSLCQICSDHPRYINSYGEITERGLGLACEEACRIILTQNTPAFLIDSESKIKYTADFPNDPYLEYMYNIRDIIIDILQNRNYKISERIACVIDFCFYIQAECSSEKSDEELLDSLGTVKKSVDTIFKEVKHKLNNGDSIKKINISKEILLDYSELEILDTRWKILLNETINNIDNTVITNTADNSCIYENLLICLTHRYFLEGYYDNMIIEKALFMFSTYIVVSCISDCTKNDIIDTVHSYSKEIEYSDINIDTLCNLYSTGIAYSLENIYTALTE